MESRCINVLYGRDYFTMDQIVLALVTFVDNASLLVYRLLSYTSPPLDHYISLYSLLMMSNTLFLDWRTPLGSSELHAKIQNVLTFMDDTAMATLELAHPSSAFARRHAVYKIATVDTKLMFIRIPGPRCVMYRRSEDCLWTKPHAASSTGCGTLQL